MIAGLLAGCTGTAEPGPTVTVTEPGPTVTVTAEPEDSSDGSSDTEALQLWEITAAETAGFLAETGESWGDCLPLEVAAGDAYCGASLIAVRYTAETAVIVWQGASKKDSPKFIEATPSTVSAYVEEGDSLIEKVSEKAAVLESNCPDGQGCAGDILQAFNAFEAAEKFFANWPSK